ncbi:LuxR C-terminal-related transcriptional regulator, partial [Actinosynnema sp. NPDC059797]
PDAAARRLVRPAGELLHRDRDLAVTALGLAGEAAAVAGDHALHRDTARLAATWRRPDEPPASRLTLDHLVGTAAGYAGRHDEAVPLLRSVVDLAERVPNATAKIRGGHAAHVLGDADRARALADRGVDAARESGLVALVPWALAHRALTALTADGHEATLTAAFEGVHAATAAGQHNAVAEHLVILALLAALRGDADTARHRVDAAADQVRRLGLGRSGTVGAWASACADLVRDRPADALRRMRCATVRGVHAGIEVMASPDVVEAAVRAGEPDTADRALRRYEAWARSTGAPSRLAVSHRCRALVSAGPEAEEHFAEAVRLHRAAGTPLELAKTELFYASRLRRGRKPRRARELLHDAVRHFEQYEADHWAERARAELRAAGEPVGQGRAPGRAADRAAGLTPQQRQIARLVAEGATNREVAARLFLSRRTVEHHLRNIFTRLDIRSRAELAGFVD